MAKRLWKSSAARDILTPEKYAARLAPLLQPPGLKILLEPGRFISGNAGILVTRVEYVKQTGRKHFVIVDAVVVEFELRRTQRRGAAAGGDRGPRRVRGTYRSTP